MSAILPVAGVVVRLGWVGFWLCAEGMSPFVSFQIRDVYIRFYESRCVAVL